MTQDAYPSCGTVQQQARENLLLGGAGKEERATCFFHYVEPGKVPWCTSLSTMGWSQQPRSCHGNEVLKAEPNVALHSCVLFPEGLRQHLQLGAYLDEAI